MMLEGVQAAVAPASLPSDTSGGDSGGDNDSAVSDDEGYESEGEVHEGFYERVLDLCGVNCEEMDEASLAQCANSTKLLCRLTGAQTRCSKEEVFEISMKL